MRATGNRFDCTDWELQANKAVSGTGACNNRFVYPRMRWLSAGCKLIAELTGNHVAPRWPLFANYPPEKTQHFHWFGVVPQLPLETPLSVCGGIDYSCDLVEADSSFGAPFCFRDSEESL